MGAPVGNNNAAKGKPWEAAIKRALAKRSRVDQHEALEKIANAFLDKCEEGDLQAIKEFGDRMDGKPSQAVAVSGGLNISGITRRVVEANGTGD